MKQFPFLVTLFAASSLFGGEQFCLSSPESRQVIEIYAREGENLPAGAPICALDAEVERLNLEMAESELAIKKKKLRINQEKLETKEQLFVKNVIPLHHLEELRNEVELEKYELHLAEKKVELARIKLDRLVIKAPSEGTLAEMKVHVGETMKANEKSKIVFETKNS